MTNSKISKKIKDALKSNFEVIESSHSKSEYNERVHEYIHEIFEDGEPEVYAAMNDTAIVEDFNLWISLQ